MGEVESEGGIVQFRDGWRGVGPTPLQESWSQIWPHKQHALVFSARDGLGAGARGGLSKIKSQKSEAKSQKSEVRSQPPEVKPGQLPEVNGRLPFREVPSFGQ